MKYLLVLLLAACGIAKADTFVCTFSKLPTYKVTIVESEGKASARTLTFFDGNLSAVKTNTALVLFSVSKKIAELNLTNTQFTSTVGRGTCERNN